MNLRFFQVTAILAALVAVGGCSAEPASSSAQRPADWKGPVGVAPKTRHDFGAIWFKDVGRATFPIKNEGEATLVIRDIKKDCGCTEPTIDRREIPPGGVATLSIDFKPLYYGIIQKNLYVFTNDPYAPEIILTVAAKCLGLASLEPSNIDLRGSLPPGGMEKTFQIRVPDDEEIGGVSFEIGNPWLEIEPVGEVEGTRASYRLRVRGLREEIRFRDEVKVSFRYAQPKNAPISNASITVTGLVTPEARALPASLQLGMAAPSERFEVEFEVDVDEGWEGDPQITTRGLFEARVDRVKGSKGRYRLTCSADVRRGRIFGFVRFDWGRERVLSIPVVGWSGA